MEWYWILLIIVGYIAIGLGLTLFLRKQEEITSDEDSLTIVTGGVTTLWPLVVIFLIFGFIVILIEDIVDNISYRIEERRYRSSSRHDRFYAYNEDAVESVEIDDIDYNERRSE